MTWRASLVLCALMVACGGSSIDIGSDTACVDNVCSCTEAGMRAAIAEGGGPFTFDCDGPTTVVTDAEIVIDNDVILDGEGNLTVDGNEDHGVFSVSKTVTAELRGFTVTNGFTDENVSSGGIFNQGRLTVTDSTVSGNSKLLSHVGVGIQNTGTMTLTNSAVSGNIGNGIWNTGTMTLTNSVVSGNSEGGIRSLKGSRLTVIESTVSGNTWGGIECSGQLTLFNSTVSGFTARRTAGTAPCQISPPKRLTWVAT